MLCLSYAGSLPVSRPLPFSSIPSLCLFLCLFYASPITSMPLLCLFYASSMPLLCLFYASSMPVPRYLPALQDWATSVWDSIWLPAPSWGSAAPQWHCLICHAGLWNLHSPPRTVGMTYGAIIRQCREALSENLLVSDPPTLILYCLPLVGSVATYLPALQE